VINGRMETEVNAPAKAVELPEVQRIPARRARYIRDERDPNAFLVHRSVFTSPEILARERELVFSKCWIYVGHGSEIPNPGDFVTRQVAGRPIIMTRDRDNQVRAASITPGRSTAPALSRCPTRRDTRRASTGRPTR
jgi:hypothetical protein